MTVAIVHVFAVLACHVHHGECHNNVYGPNQRLSPGCRLCHDCLFFDAIIALPSLPSPKFDDRIKVRLRFLVRFDLHFEVVRVARHIVGPLFLHYRWIAEHATALKNMASSSVVRSRAISIRFPEPQNVHGSVFLRKCACCHSDC